MNIHVESAHDTDHALPPLLLQQLLHRIISFVGIAIITSLIACARVAPLNPQESFREISAPDLGDDLNFVGLAESIQLQLDILKGSPHRVMQFGMHSVTRASYASALENLLNELHSQRPTHAKLEYIRRNFRFFEYFGGTDWGEVLLTSYFEPVIAGSRSRTQRFSRALLSKPADLVTIPLNSFSERFTQEKPLKGRLQGSTIIPYYSREEIDGKSALRSQKLELTWTDPIDGFFLQIQGSGTIAYEDGTEEHLVYADKNGHKYEAIGKFLKERISPHPVTMQRIEQLLHSMPSKECDAILFRNPSYVFFSKSAKRAITSLGVPATPGRTIATDPRFAPKGALAFLQFPRPVFQSVSPSTVDEPIFVPTSRFVIDQDTGGAITGTGRVDLFWGRGDEAKRSAGIIQHAARLVYLAPR
jgi:membrane-bound lytic murein transglycosylase A